MYTPRLSSCLADTGLTSCRSLRCQAQAKSSGEQQQRFLQELSDERQSRHRSEQQARLRDEQGRSGPEVSGPRSIPGFIHEVILKANVPVLELKADGVAHHRKIEREGQCAKLPFGTVHRPQIPG